MTNRNPSKFTTTFTWTDTEYSGPVRVRVKGHGDFTTTTNTIRTRTTKSVGVEVVIDIAGLLQEAAGRAATSKSGRGKLLRGIVQAKRLGPPQVLKIDGEQVPLPERYELIVDSE